MPVAALDASLGDLGGASLQSVAFRLWQRSRRRPEALPRSAVFVDGLEKIRRRSRGTSAHATRARELVVSMLDGVEIELPRRSGTPYGEDFALSTDAWWVVAAMRVPRDVVEADDADLRSAVVDLGLPDELVARFDLVLPLRPLDVASYEQLLTGPTGLITKAATTLAAWGTSLTFTPDAIAHLAASAVDAPDGAWALRRWIQRCVAEAETTVTALRLDASDVERITRA